MPLAMRRAFWRTGHWHRERKGRHHPAKRTFLKLLLFGHLVRDLCITEVAVSLKIDPRTLRSWVRYLTTRGALDIINDGRGRDLGLRVQVNRARVRELIGELDQGERELAARRRRRHSFIWKSDPSPIPLSRGREKDPPSPIAKVLGELGLNSWRPPATRFESPDPDPDALRAAIKGKPCQETKPRGGGPQDAEASGTVQVKDPELAALLERLRQKIIDGAKNAASKTASGVIPVASLPVRADPAIHGTIRSRMMVQQEVISNTQLVSKKTSTGRRTL